MANSAKAGSIFSHVTAGAIRGVAFHITTTYILPIGAPLVAGYLGYLQGLPWMYIWMGALFSFAMAAHGAVQFDTWLQRRRVADKLGFNHLRLVSDIRGTPTLALGVGLTSLADSPIEFEISECRTRINSRVPAKRTYDRRNFTVPPRGTAYFDDHLIDFGPAPAPGALDGHIEMIISYGRPGMLKHELVIRKDVTVAFDGNGTPAIASFTDAA